MTPEEIARNKRLQNSTSASFHIPIPSKDDMQGVIGMVKAV
jgi:hypothetical protein